MNPTEVKIDNPNAIKITDVPRGFHWFDSEFDRFDTFYYMANTRIDWLIRCKKDKSRIGYWICDLSLNPTNAMNDGRFLGENYNLIAGSKLIEMLLDNHDAPYHDWLLFNLDWLRRYND